jgi:hypothetical protein
LPKDSIKKSEPEKNSEKAPSPEMTADKNSGSKKATIKAVEEPTPKVPEDDQVELESEDNYEDEADDEPKGLS